MIWRVEIKHKQGIFQAQAEGLTKDILDFGIRSISKVEVIQIYNLEGNLTEEQIRLVCEELLTDPITQEYSFFNSRVLLPRANENHLRIIEIAYHPGVMDPVESSTLKGIRDLGVKEVQSVRTARKYLLYGEISAPELETIVNKVLANKLIQHVVDYEEREKTLALGDSLEKFNLILVDLIKVHDKELKKISEEGQLFLNLEEMKAIQKYFKKKGRNPTDCELETIAQTWSEHCYHKTFRGDILYTYRDKGKKKKKRIVNLLKSTIMKATQKINKSWCVSVFHDNAGIIAFDKEHHVCFKVETHNHPSALEPFGGANTGVGGVIRDILGTGLGAKPICSSDVFCFAPPDYEFDALPAGTLHPKRIMKGVVSGVRDYGNKMGIPTVNGAIVFDKQFVGNPLVFCGNVGLIPKNRVLKKVRKGDLIVVVGGRTGRDGIHGATFSSGELTSSSEIVSSGAVQIGNPIEEKKVCDALLKARDENLYTAITDCGAGGFSSAVGEMGKEAGAKVDLEKALLKYKGLTYREIWISESQERMVLAVPQKNMNRLKQIFEGENVEAMVIGEFTETKRLELFYHGCQVCDLDMDFLHEGITKITKEALWTAPKIKEPKFICPKDLTVSLLSVLSHYNVCSKEWVIRQYDHEVQGSSVIKPLVGVNNDGPSDASVLRPKLFSNKGIAVSNGINVRFGMIDPYAMSASCIDEAIRQIIAVGGDLDRIAILDNFCWGNPDKPDRLGALVRSALGCYDTAIGFKVPFISGKDSLYNEYTHEGKSIAIPGTILISAIGIIEDVAKAVTMDFKKHGNLIYCVGTTFNELGGSVYFDRLGELGARVPQVNPRKATKIFKAVSKAVQKGLVRSIHDCSEGGLAVCLAEMAFAGGMGVTVRLDQVPFGGREKRDDFILFSESNSRFLIEVEPDNALALHDLFQGIPYALIGNIEASGEFIVYGVDNQVCMNTYIQQLKEAWQKPLGW